MTFIFPDIWKSSPKLTFIFFRGDETTNQNTKMVINGGFHEWGTPRWMVYNGKSHKLRMIWEYPYLRKPPNGLRTWMMWE